MLFRRDVWVLPTQQNFEKRLLAAARPNLHIFRLLENFLELYSESYKPISKVCVLSGNFSKLSLKNEGV